MVYKWPHHSAPSYLAEICTPVSTDVIWRQLAIVQRMATL